MQNSRQQFYQLQMNKVYLMQIEIIKLSRAEERQSELTSFWLANIEAAATGAHTYTLNAWHTLNKWHKIRCSSDATEKVLQAKIWIIIETFGVLPSAEQNKTRVRDVFCSFCHSLLPPPHRQVVVVVVVVVVAFLQCLHWWNGARSLSATQVFAKASCVAVFRFGTWDHQESLQLLQAHFANNHSGNEITACQPPQTVQTMSVMFIAAVPGANNLAMVCQCFHKEMMMKLLQQATCDLKNELSFQHRHVWIALFFAFWTCYLVWLWSGHSDYIRKFFFMHDDCGGGYMSRRRRGTVKK